MCQVFLLDLQNGKLTQNGRCFQMVLRLSIIVLLVAFDVGGVHRASLSHQLFPDFLVHDRCTRGEGGWLHMPPPFQLFFDIFGAFMGRRQGGRCLLLFRLFFVIFGAIRGADRGFRPFFPGFLCFC